MIRIKKPDLSDRQKKLLLALAATVLKWLQEGSGSKAARFRKPV